MPEPIPAPRRKAANGEHLFVSTNDPRKCKPHLWIRTQLRDSGEVTACAVCGKLKRGETMPEQWEAVLR